MNDINNLKYASMGGNYGRTARVCENCKPHFEAVQTREDELASLNVKLDDAWERYSNDCVSKEEAQAVSNEVASLEAVVRNFEAELKRVAGMVRGANQQEISDLEQVIRQEESNVSKLLDAFQGRQKMFLPYPEDGDLSEFVRKKEDLVRENIELERDLEHLSAHLRAAERVEDKLEIPLVDDDTEEEEYRREVQALKDSCMKLTSEVEFRERMLMHGLRPPRRS